MKIKTLYILGFINAGLGSALLLLFPFIAQQFGLNLTEAGFIKSIFNICNIIFAVPSLFLINKFNNKKLLFLADILAGLSFAALGIAPGLLLVLLFRITWSFGLAIRHPLNKAELSRQAPSGQQGKTIGNFGGIVEIGKTIVTTLCGYMIIWLGWQTTTIYLGLAGVLLVLIVAYFTRKDPYTDQHIPGAKINIKKLLTNKRIAWAYACSALDSFASNSIPLFLPFLILYYNYDVATLALINAVMLIGSVAGRFFLGGLADKHRPGLVFAVCELAMGVMALTLGLSSNLIIIIIAAFCIGLVIRGTSPVTSVMIVYSVGKDNNPKSAFALEMILFNIFGLISSTFFGWIGDSSNLQVMFLCFSVTALLPAAAGLVFNKVATGKDFEQKVPETIINIGK